MSLVRPITRHDIKGPALYAPIRDDFRKHIIALKKPRRVLIGDRVSLVFENRHTVTSQIEEICRVENLVTDALVDYIHHAHTWSPEFMAARAQSISLPHDYAPDLPGIQAPVLLIHGRYDRMVAFEVSIAILNHIADSRLVLLNNCGHWAPFEKPAEWTAQVLAFLQGY